MIPTRSSAHLAFVRSLPCCVCFRTRGVQACHTPGTRGLGQKRSDLETIPMCELHHDEQHRIGWKQFIVSYRLDVPALVLALQEKPRIFPGRSGLREGIFDSGGSRFYFAHYRDEVFQLLATHYTLESSIQEAKRVCREYLIDQLFTLRETRAG